MSAAPSGPFPVAVPARQARAEMERRFAGLNGTGSQPELPGPEMSLPEALAHLDRADAASRAARQAAQARPPLQPTFTPAAGLPQAPPGPRPLQASEHPAGTFTALSPWQQWLQRCQPKQYPAPDAATPFYSAALRDHAEREMNAALRPAAGPWEVTPPAHASWPACQQTAMTPLPACDATARFRSARAYMRTMDRLTGTRGLPLPKAALPAPDPRWRDLIDATVQAAGEAAGRHGKAQAYMRLAGYITACPDYETALEMAQSAAGCGLTVPGFTAPAREQHGSAA